MKKEIFRYWLCESNIYDRKFQIDFDDYEKIRFDLTEEKIGYRLINVSEITIGFTNSVERDLYLYDYYLVVDSLTYSKYSEI